MRDTGAAAAVVGVGGVISAEGVGRERGFTWGRGRVNTEGAGLKEAEVSATCVMRAASMRARARVCVFARACTRARAVFVRVCMCMRVCLRRGACRQGTRSRIRAPTSRKTAARSGVGSSPTSST